MTLLAALALIASHAAVLLAGFALGHGRNAKVRSEIARIGAMMIEAMRAKT